jgi:outer membrane receptor protein involved in Fe transport
MGLAAEAGVSLGKAHRLSYGLNLTDESVSAVRRAVDVFTGEEIQRGRDPSRDGIERDQIAVFAEDRVEISPDLALRLGGRFSSYSITGTQQNAAGTFPLDADGDGLSGYLRLSWRLGETLHLFGGYDRGFRLPGIDEVTGYTPREGVTGLPNPRLEIPTVDALEIGLRHRSARAGVAVAFFRQEIADAPLLVPTAPPPLAPAVALPGAGASRWVRSQSVGEARIDGVELSADLSLPLGLDLWGLAVAIEGDHPATGAALAGIPPAYGAAGLRWSGPWPWEPWVETMVRYSAEKKRLAPTEAATNEAASLESQDVITVRAGLTLPPRLRLVFSLENPADEAYRPYGSFLYAPGRNLALTAEFVF